ncbi:MAG: hypothetical protein ACXWC1_30060, partial [Burkholderiales bacterium]
CEWDGSAIELTNEFCAVLRALISNPAHPISSNLAEKLIAMGLATQWACRLAITPASWTTSGIFQLRLRLP